MITVVEDVCVIEHLFFLHGDERNAALCVVMTSFTATSITSSMAVKDFALP